MITVKELREYLCLDPKMDRRVEFLRKYLMSEWNKQTHITWNTPVPNTTPQFTKLFETDETSPTASIYLLNPAVVIDEIKMWGADEDEADGVVLIADDYRLIQDENCPWAELQPKGQSDDFGLSPNSWDCFVQVKYDAGYDCDAIDGVPDDFFDIKEAMMMQGDFHLKRNSDTKLIQKTQGFKGGSTSYKDGPWHELWSAAVEQWKWKG